jgi:hypothetical protein
VAEPVGSLDYDLAIDVHGTEPRTEDAGLAFDGLFGDWIMGEPLQLTALRGIG